MAGHSKWAKIKHQKSINDAKKGKIFSKMGQQIAIAARDGGADLEANFSLRLLVDKAKSVSMPAENIQRAIDRGAGKGGDAITLEHMTYEGFGPAGVLVMVTALTDNKNRTVSEMRGLFSEYGGNMGESGSVSWNFDHKGLVTVQAAKVKKSEKYGGEDEVVAQPLDEVMGQVFEIDGILDMQEYRDVDEKGKEVDFIEVYTDPKQLAHVRDAINAKGYIVKSADLVWTPKNVKPLPPEDVNKVNSFVEGLEEYDDVQDVWTDVDPDVVQ